MNTQDDRGFTLLELIISLTIFSLVVVVVYATLSLGVGAATRGEARSIQNQRARAALALIARQLKSAYPLTLEAEDGIFVYFFGEPDAVSFISAAGRPEVGGLEKIMYFLKEHEGRHSLWVRTAAPALPADLVEEREGSLIQETEVLPEVESLTWEYFGRVQTDEEWTDHWDGKEQRSLPTAVRCSWQAHLGELPYEWQIEVPINVQTSQSTSRTASQGRVTSRLRRSLRGYTGR